MNVFRHRFWGLPLRPITNFLCVKDFCWLLKTFVSFKPEKIILIQGTIEIGGDFIVYGSGNIQVRSQSGSKILNVKGNFVKNGAGNFKNYFYGVAVYALTKYSYNK